MARRLTMNRGQWIQIGATVAVLRDGDLYIASFNQSDDDIRAFMKRPWVMTSSDSVHGHPRMYGTFARKYEQYVTKDKIIGLAQFVRSSSALTPRSSIPTTSLPSSPPSVHVPPTTA